MFSKNMSLSILASKANLDSECCGQAGWGERSGLNVDSSFRIPAHEWSSDSVEWALYTAFYGIKMLVSAEINRI